MVNPVIYCIVVVFGGMVLLLVNSPQYAGFLLLLLRVRKLLVLGNHDIQGRSGDVVKLLVVVPLWFPGS